MRRFLMWMMICLLPLRLWASDAMAVQHVPAAAQAAVVAMAQDAHPCHAAEDAAKASPAQTTKHGSACGDCSVCHGPIAGPALPSWAAPTLPAAVPHTLGWSALSAHTPPQLKPPRV